LTEIRLQGQNDSRHHKPGTGDPVKPLSSNDEDHLRVDYEAVIREAIQLGYP
jgi:hypothetical protein